MCVNLMEQIVMEVMEENWAVLHMPCSCQTCKDDLMALALNALPPQYVTRNEGRLFQKVKLMQEQTLADILCELARAAKIVAEQQNHESTILPLAGQAQVCYFIN